MSHRDVIPPDEQDQLGIEELDLPTWMHKRSDIGKKNAIGWVMIDDSSFKKPPPKKETVEPLTPEELLAIKKAGYAEGFKYGKEKGFEQGFASGHEEGEKKGHDVGVEKGIVEGIAQGQSEIDARCQMWESVIEKLEHPLRNLDQNVEDQLIQLAMELARQIIFVEVTVSKETLYAVLREGIRYLPVSSHGIDIRLNPQDMFWLRERYSEAECERRNWHLKDDVDVPRGDVHLISDMSSLHLDLRDRVESLMQNFMRNNLPEEEITLEKSDEVSEDTHLEQSQEQTEEQSQEQTEEQTQNHASTTETDDVPPDEKDSNIDANDDDQFTSEED